jgi:hypothetical protein
MRLRGGSLRHVRTLSVSVLAAAGALAFPAVALAASGTGAPYGPTITVTGTPGGQTVLCTIPVPAAGGTIGCDNINVTVPAGYDGLELVLSDGPAPSPAITPAITIGFYYIATGVKYTGTFVPPVTVVYTNSAVTAGDAVLVYVPSTGQWVPPPSGLIASATTSNGEVTLTVTGDPTFYVPGSAIVGATVPVTGKPFLAEGLLAGGLLVGGILVLGVALRRRPTRFA